MALYPDDDQALEAALSFIDEFTFDGEGLPAAQIAVVKTHGLHRNEVALVPRGPTNVVTNAIAPANEAVITGEELSRSMLCAPRCKAPLLLGSTEDEATKRRTVNERKKLLRKTGVYGDPNRARNARRLEIAYLKEQIETLQIDLHALRGQKDRSKETSASLMSSSTEMSVQIPSMWQAVANSQRKRREDSELENVRLKLILDRHQKMADNLRALIKKRASQLANECSSFMDASAPKPHVVHVLDFRGDVADFEALFRLNEAAYRELDAIFADNGLADMVVSPSDVHIREGVGGKYLELFANKILPFKLSDAKEAAWDHFKGIKKHACNGSVYTKSAKNLNEPYTIIEDFTKELYSNNSRADIKVKQVVRRYVERDRDVVIWMSHVSPTEIKHKMLRGLAYHLRGYALTKRSPASTPGRELSQLQFCSLISLDQEPGTRYDPANARVLINFLIANTVQNIRNHQDRIESALVDRALQEHM
ncbi:M96 mating-specific protein family [Phytophthora cinnamomi]|uniref:M96 mating-specific protein family n=1 Tax=Phytophthora cinnamomi TaxID=4785 RepID=UPI00355A319E|nr:M96 mating-specific protein family [Phytophthora cinnamomi]